LESPSKPEYEFVTLGFGGIVAGNELPIEAPIGPVRLAEFWLKLAENTVLAEML